MQSRVPTGTLPWLWALRNGKRSGWSRCLQRVRGVLTAIMLGVGRAVGETMTVLMVTGNAPVLLKGLGTLFSPVRTMTATIAAEMGEVARGSTHYHVLFLIGIILFLISLIVNVTASAVVFRQVKRQERILS
jgi:phosphate transport system permease protein